MMRYDVEAKGGAAHCDQRDLERCTRRLEVLPAKVIVAASFTKASVLPHARRDGSDGTSSPWSGVSGFRFHKANLGKKADRSAICQASNFRKPNIPPCSALVRCTVPLTQPLLRTPSLPLSFDFNAQFTSAACTRPVNYTCVACLLFPLLLGHICRNPSGQIEPSIALDRILELLPAGLLVGVIWQLQHVDTRARRRQPARIVSSLPDGKQRIQLAEA